MYNMKSELFDIRYVCNVNPLMNVQHQCFSHCELLFITIATDTHIQPVGQQVCVNMEFFYYFSDISKYALVLMMHSEQTI